MRAAPKSRWTKEFQRRRSSPWCGGRIRESASRHHGVTTSHDPWRLDGRLPPWLKKDTSIVFPVFRVSKSWILQIKMLYPKDGISIEIWWNQLWWFSGRHLSKLGPSLAGWWWHHLRFNQWHGQWLSDVDPSCPPWKLDTRHQPLVGYCIVFPQNQWSCPRDLWLTIPWILICVQCVHKQK
jgi:hypothetical protein